MTYTLERVNSCVAEVGQALYRLTYESDYIPELNVWRHVLIRGEKLYPLPPDAQAQHETVTNACGSVARLPQGKL